jgi:hypothetical protein
MPAAQAVALAGDDNAIVLEDATALFRSIRLHVDEAEINLVRRADALARDCLGAIDGRSDARAMVADIEARARLADAEESLSASILISQVRALFYAAIVLMVRSARSLRFGSRSR